MSNNREDSNSAGGGTRMNKGNVFALPGSKSATKPTSAATAEGSISSHRRGDGSDGSGIPHQTPSRFASSPSPRPVSESVPPRRSLVRLPGETAFPIQSTALKRDVLGQIILGHAKTQPTVTKPQAPSRSRSLADLL